MGILLPFQERCYGVNDSKVEEILTVVTNIGMDYGCKAMTSVKEGYNNSLKFSFAQM